MLQSYNKVLVLLSSLRVGFRRVRYPTGLDQSLSHGFKQKSSRKQVTEFPIGTQILEGYICKSYMGLMKFSKLSLSL